MADAKGLIRDYRVLYVLVTRPRLNRLIRMCVRWIRIQPVKTPKKNMVPSSGVSMNNKQAAYTTVLFDQQSELQRRSLHFHV